MRYIALDIGSTTIKRAFLDTGALTAVSDGGAPFPAPCTQPPRFEVDADALTALCKRLIDEGLDAHPDACGILFSVQMHGCVITDADGTPLTGYISWRDALCAERGPNERPMIDTLIASIPMNMQLHTGASIKPKQSLASLYARKQLGLSLPQGALFHTLEGYLLHRLGAAHSAHLTMAASTGLCDVQEGTWSAGIINMAGLGALRLPSLINGMAQVGVYRRGGAEYALYPGVGDHQVCVLGSLARSFSDIGINIGTGAMEGRITDRFNTAMECRPLMDGLFVDTITGLPGGRHLQAYHDLLADAARIGGAPPGPDTIWPYITDPSLIPVDGRGGITATFGERDTLSLERIAEAGSVTDMTAALYRGMAARYAADAKRLGGGERLVFTGGAAARNPALRAFIEASCGMPGVIHEGDAVTEGLLVLAMMAEGMSMSEAQSTLASRKQSLQ